MDTRTVTAASERDRPLDAVQPQLVLVTDRAHPSAGGARHSLASIERVIIGRGPRRTAARVVEDGKATLKILLPDERVSSLHARIERRDGGFCLVDCGSTNGTHVSGRRVGETVLADGDVIEIGQTFLRYRRAMVTPIDASGDIDASELSGLPKAFGTLLPWLMHDLGTLSRLARSDVSVLLRGETGTGKEVLARAIHAESGRKGEFVAVNCGALPATLVESLLFGYKRGAFSGATQDELGLVRTAEGGTLFLDEIGDLGAPGQAAVLRVLQEREVLPLGATRPTPIDVRIVAATHRPVEALAASGEFRQDLLARIGGFTYAVPSLRDRIDDLGLLLATLIGKLALERASTMSLTSDLVYAMLEHDWPFNVREVEQRLRTAVILAVDGRMQLAHVWKDGPPKDGSPVVPAGKTLSKEDEALHTDLVAKLVEYRGNVTQVGEALGKRRTTVQRWMRRLGIDPDRFR